MPIFTSDEITALCEDFTEDLKKISVLVLVLHGEDDQVVNPAMTAPVTAKLVANGTLKTYLGVPARDADHARGRDRPRPAGLHPVLAQVNAQASLAGQLEDPAGE